VKGASAPKYRRQGEQEERAPTHPLHGCNTVWRGPVTVPGNGADSLLPTVAGRWFVA